MHHADLVDLLLNKLGWSSPTKSLILGWLK